jgi:hypothetical protein
MFVAPSDRPSGEEPAKPYSEGVFAMWAPLMFGVVLAAVLMGRASKEAPAYTPPVKAGPAQHPVRGPA